MKNPYYHFSNYVLRTPILDLAFYENLTSEKIVSDDDFIGAIENPLIQEGIFLASPTLFFEIRKWLDYGLEEKKLKKLRYAMLKYLTRMSTRCTPFGIFAGCSLGSFGKQEIFLDSNVISNKRHTRLDMNYLVAFSSDISKKKAIMEQLTYYPNSSLYRIGGKLRYIEYFFDKHTRSHRIVEVDSSNLIEKILESARYGMVFNDLLKIILKNRIPKKVAINFLNQLIENQVLISELEPSTCGQEYINQLIGVLKKLKNVRPYLIFLNKVKRELQQIDTNFNNPFRRYIQLSKEIEKQDTDFELKYLFQTDLEIRPLKNQISISVIDSIKKGMSFLNRIAIVESKSRLDNFKEAFYKRYENRVIPLVKALDVETGIGYLQNRNNGDVNPLVDDIELPPDERAVNSIKINWNTIHNVLEEKLIENDRNGGQKIVLTDNDFPDLPIQWDDLPDTIACNISIINDSGVEKIKFAGVSGSCGANLITRFCHGDKALNKFAKQIIKKEQELNDDRILAEIVHLPEARVGNILMRPSFRDYEIPYLANSEVNLDKQISIEDLFISIKDKKLILYSKKLHKEIMPRLTSAHNYALSTLPIYHFLCDMQTNNIRTGLHFSFGPLLSKRSFLPRVEYKNLIFSSAQWRIKSKSIENLLKNLDNHKILEEEIFRWRRKMKLPQYVMLCDGDNELLINLENITSTQMLLDMVKLRREFLLREFLFAGNNLVKSQDSYYTHQILLALYNGGKSKTEIESNP